MGLHVHSISDLPLSESRAYYIYVLDSTAGMSLCPMLYSRTFRKSRPFVLRTMQSWSKAFRTVTSTLMCFRGLA